MRFCTALVGEGGEHARVLESRTPLPRARPHTLQSDLDGDRLEPGVPESVSEDVGSGGRASARVREEETQQVNPGAVPAGGDAD